MLLPSIRGEIARSITSTIASTSRTFLQRAGLILLLTLTLAACSDKNPTEYKPDPTALELNNSAVQALEQHNLDRALELVDKAIAADSRFYSAYTNKGAILKERGRDKEAIAAFRKAISLNPDFADAYVPLGALYEKQGKTPYAKKHYAIAVRLYQDAFQKEPDDPRIVANLAIALFLNDDRNAALKCLTEYLARHPEDETISRVMPRIEAKDRNGFTGRRTGKQ